MTKNHGPNPHNPPNPQGLKNSENQSSGYGFCTATSEYTSAYIFDKMEHESLQNLPKDASGVEIIASYVSRLDNRSGVYRMLDADGQVLYVGKAKSLKKRVANYTQYDRNSLRIQRMISLTKAMEFVVTGSEAEALLLEASLIKSLKPRYNVLLRDDKSFPDILIRTEHDFPQIVKHRGKRTKEKGQYFGPFASAGAVDDTIEMLQRAFLLRDCTDHTFATRERPCLQYQIKRCSAPCVGMITQDDYQQSVKQAADFLRGRSHDIITQLSSDMQQAANAMDYEQAAVLRDRIRALTAIQGGASHSVHVDDADVFAIDVNGGQSCVQVFFYRSGTSFGNRAFYPAHDKDLSPEQILQSFIGQFYQNFDCPSEILVGVNLPQQDVLAEALSMISGKKITVHRPKRGDKAKAVMAAYDNAKQSLNRRLTERASQMQMLMALGDMLDLDTMPERVEVYDNSHMQGAGAVGAMIVAGVDGFLTGEYRKFNIKNTDSLNRNNDDFAMMTEVLTRRFKRLKEDDNNFARPDVVIIDGGRGQLNAVQKVFDKLNIKGIALMAIAKGAERDSGRETIHRVGLPELLLRPNSPLSYFLQRLRDESHRYVIGTHRKKRTKTMLENPLDGIAGVGAKRRKALLLRFGSAKGVASASVEEIAGVDGISKELAQMILDTLN